MHPTDLQVPISRIRGLECVADSDRVVLEEPLEIQIGFSTLDAKRDRKSVTVTMRTPTSPNPPYSSDLELALGFLYSEGIILNIDQIAETKPLGCAPEGSGAPSGVLIELRPEVRVDLASLQNLHRTFYSNSSCGVCGKGSRAALLSAPLSTQRFWQTRSRPNDVTFSQKPQAKITKDLVHRLPELLRLSQPVFDQTGGLHCAALFDFHGNLIVSREDIGRHNAVDKAIGFALQRKLLPLPESVLFVSSRVSFELVQKASRAGLGVLAGMGAASSLAIELATETDLTLIGFVRNNRFNVYTGDWRIEL